MATQSTNDNKPFDKTQGKPMTMDDLMASLGTKPLTFSRGDEIEGKIVLISDSEVVLDLGTKAEGVINKKDIPQDIAQSLKVGDKLKAFVVVSETDSGQAILSLSRQINTGGKRGADLAKKWQRFITALDRKTKMTGKVIEVNKGGLVVEIEGNRGFVPSSQVGLDQITGDEGLESMVGQDIVVSVIEVDLKNNRLILSGRKEVSKETQEKLASFNSGQEVTAKIIAIVPFGLLLDLDGVEGVVYSQEVSWDADINLGDLYKVGQEVIGKVIGKDEVLGKLNISLRQLSEDPFTKLAEEFEPDDVITGVIKNITQSGIDIDLEQGIQGFIPAEKLDAGTLYTIGQKTNFLVDSVDKIKRRIILAPFLTSTVGLIYK